MILNEFFNLPQVFEKDMNEGVMSEIDAELRNIVANEDFDALYELFTANTPAGKFVQDMYDDVVIDTGLHPDDDFERIEQIVFDRLADDFGEQGVAEGKEELHTQLQSINQKLKLMRGGPVGEPNSMAFVEKRKELLKQKEQILSQLKQGVAEGTRERLSNLHDKIRKEKDLPDPKEYLKIAQQKKKEIADLKAQDKKEVGEGKGDYVPPKEANYDEKYQAMVKRVGEKAKQQEKSKQQPKQPVRESRRALLKQIIQS